MKCTVCQHDESSVIRTVDDGKVIRRRRECARCRHRWTTYETLEDAAAELGRIKGLLAPVVEAMK